MKTRLIIIAFFILTMRVSHATQDWTWSFNTKNVHFEYRYHSSKFETENKLNILAELLEKLIQLKGYKTEQIYIFFRPVYSNEDTVKYTLGYGNFSYWDYFKDHQSEKKIPANGIKVFIKDGDLDIKKVLNLINCALKNVDNIKKQQKKIYWAECYDFIFSIPDPMIVSYYNSSDNSVDQLLEQKIYRKIKKTESTGEIDYYFQNNKYHFYDTRKPDDYSFMNSEEAKKLSGRDILVVDNVHEIAADEGVKSNFVFINDSVFYFIPEYFNPVRGPFKVDSICPFRPPIIDVFFEDYSSNKYYLFFLDNFLSYRHKALFIPEKNLLVSNFEKAEDELIAVLLKKKDFIKDSHRAGLAFILMLLFFSIGANIWQCSKRIK